MTEEEFVNLCKGKKVDKPTDKKIPAGLNETKEKVNDPKVGSVEVTHPVDGGKKHPKIGCAWDAMGPLAGSGESGPYDGIADGEGAGVAEGAPVAMAGESISRKALNTCLEAIANKYPASQVIEVIREILKEPTERPTMLYATAEGLGAGEEPEEVPDDIFTSDDDEKISFAAAAVEAALASFKKIAGYDYPFGTTHSLKA